MFDDLRAAFREALDNFNKELRRENVSETADRLLVGMKREISDEKAQVASLEAQLEKARADSLREKELGMTCRRRERLARDIGDEETASVAVQHAIKHEGHHSLLDKKIVAMQEELEFRRWNVDDMIEKFTEAKQQRDSLAATTGRAGARESFAAADDLFSELDRMAEQIEGGHRQANGVEAIEGLDLGSVDDSDYDVSTDVPLKEAELDVDAALAELKRRMGKS